MISLTKLHISKLFEKHFAFLRDYGYVLKKSNDSAFYSQSLFVNESKSIVISIVYELRENYLSVSAWKIINSKLWEMKNDKQSTSLEMLSKQENNVPLRRLPTYDALNKEAFDDYIKEYATEFKIHVENLPNYLNIQE